MPLFEFSCLNCHYIFEILIGINDEYPVCPICGGETDKIPAAPVAHFKGKGFYQTDYGRRRL